MRPDTNDTEMRDQGLAKHMPVAQTCSNTPEGAIIPDERAAEDRIAVIYERGDVPPVITISDVSRSVQTVLANGIAVAVVACAKGPQLTPDDVLLVERVVGDPT